MKTFLIAVFVTASLCACNLKPATLEMTSNSGGGTMTTTDVFGNKTTCNTFIVGGTISTSCH